MAESTYTQTVTELRGDMREGFARIDGRLDTLTKTVEAATESQAVASKELRKDVDDHEIRLRVQEARKTVSPWQLWSVFGTVAGLVIAASAVIVNAIK